MNKVIVVEPRDNYVLFVKLSNGKEGEFDVSGYLNKGIFKELQNVSYFKQVRPAFGGVIWPHEQDFSADTIKIEMRGLEEHYA
ncbi:MAG: DUF2442 domain-containing protein [Chromatiaceae bacterium]|nr:DUF2442 domain-containing protein [Chromatiaceae bacterium]